MVADSDRRLPGVDPEGRRRLRIGRAPVGRTHPDGAVHGARIRGSGRGAAPRLAGRVPSGVWGQRLQHPGIAGPIGQVLRGAPSLRRAGLAGLRVGYGAFPLDIIEQLWKIKQPYNVNVAGQIAAQASLADRKRLRRNITQLLEERERFYTSLAQFDWLKPYPSQTNFVLCRIEGRTTAQDVKQKLMEQGILVRYYNSPGLTDHIRISMGTPTQMARLEEALKAF